MNISSINKVNTNDYQQLHNKSNEAVMRILVRGNKPKLDCYIKEKNLQINCYNAQGLSVEASDEKMVKGSHISSSILDLINFESNGFREHYDICSIGGVKFTKEQIPKLEEERCYDIKAKNNEIVFETGNYYKFKDKKGKTHFLACAYDNLSNPYSEILRGNVDEESNNMDLFWSLLAHDGTYIGLYFEDTEKQILNDAGINEGFFSVQVGKYKQEYYYSNGIAGSAVSKSRYDSKYNMLMNEPDIYDKFEPGSIFKIGGEEYILSADKKLDIPYGADIFDFIYPKLYNKTD